MREDGIGLGFQTDGGEGRWQVGPFPDFDGAEIIESVVALVIADAVGGIGRTGLVRHIAEIAYEALP